MADLNVKLRVTQDGSLKRALNGVTKEGKKAEKAIRKEVEKTQAMRKKGFRDQDMAQRNAAARTKQIIRRAEMDARTEVAKTNRERKEGMIKATREGVKKSRSLLKGLGAVGVAGALTARRGFDRARGITGAPTIEQNIANAKQFQRRMTLLQNQAELTDAGRDDVQKRIQEQGKKGTLSPLDILGGVEAVQRLEGGDALEDFFKSMDSAAMFAEGLGANFEGLAKLTTVLGRQFHISQTEMDEMVGFMAEAGVKGSVELENFSAEFPRVMGLFTTLLGRRGTEGAKEFSAVAQAVQTGFPDRPEMAADAMKALVSTLSQPRTQKVLRTRGLDSKRNTIPEIAETLFRNPLNDKQMNKAFNRQALNAMVAIINQYDPSNPKGNVIEDVMASSGLNQLDRASTNTARIRSDALGQDQMRANQMQAEMIDNFQNTASAALRVTKAFDELASTMPGSAIIGQSVAEFLGALGGMTLAMKVFGAKKAVDPVAESLKTLTKGGSTATAGAGLGGGALVAGLLGTTAATALAAYGYNQASKIEGIQSMPTPGNPFGMPTMFKSSAESLEKASKSIESSANIMEQKLRNAAPIGATE